MLRGLKMEKDIRGINATGVFYPVVSCKCGSEIEHTSLIDKLKKWNDKILALIKGWCKKKLVFADPLLPFEYGHSQISTFASRANHPAIQNLQNSLNIYTEIMDKPLIKLEMLYN